MTEQKQRIPWNKGLTKETDNRVKQYATKNIDSHKGQISKKRIYSRNPDDWKIKCEGCDNFLIYTSIDSFKQANFKNKNRTESLKCPDCRFTYEEKNRRIRLKNTYGNKTPEEKRQLLSDIHKNRWAAYSDDKRNAIISLMKDNINKRSPREKHEQYRKVSESNKKRMAELGYEYKFKPGYNKESIVFIDTKLCEKFNTTFVHAESEFGEFKIHDVENRCFYYADGYCKRLNLWIEIDEHQKFKNGKLKNEHIVKHHRIKELLNCDIIRYRCRKNYKKHELIQMEEYYNDIENIFFQN